MKKGFIFLYILLLTFKLNAQIIDSLIGEYYLHGEMETAGGIRLDSNGRFQFFFAYGALDRQASGTWEKDGDQLILNSEPKIINDFLLTGSRVSTDKQLIISITDVSPQILPYIKAMVFSKGQSYSASSNDKGSIVLPLLKADSIILQFQWCPEKVSGFAVNNSQHNHFTFKMQPTITNVNFDRATFTISSNEIAGVLPFSGNHICHFRRAGE